MSKLRLIGNMEGVDKRRTNRSKVYLSEKLKVQLSHDSFQTSCQLVDFTPFGFGVVSELDESRMLFQNGDQVNVKFEHLQLSMDQVATVVNRRSVHWNNKRYTRLGLEFIQEQARPEGIDARGNMRFKTGGLANIICSCKDFTVPHQNAFFQVVDISIKGMLLSTSSRNKFLQPGSRHRMKISVPTLGTFEETLIVRHIRPADEGRSYLLGCEFDLANHRTLQALAEYSLNFSPDLSYRDLLAEGFRLSLDTQAITVKSSEDPDDFASILQLRSEAYKGSGTLGFKANDPLEAFTDELDKYSRQVVAKIGGRLAGCSRIVFTEGQAERSGLCHYEQFPELLRGKNYVEFSKLCTHPDFRDGPLLMRLILEMFRISLLSGADYIVIFAREYLVKTYKRFGMTTHGEPFVVAGYPMQFMYGYCPDFLHGKNTEFAPWAFGVAPLVRELQESGQINVHWRTQVKSWIGLSVRPYMIDILEKKVDERLRKKMQKRS